MRHLTYAIFAQGSAPGTPQAPGGSALGPKPPGGTNPTPASAPPDRFGLLGLLSVIRMTDPDLTTLALGTDLTTLGLHLNSSDNVYKTFAHPWADNPLKPEPEFKVGELKPAGGGGGGGDSPFKSEPELKVGNLKPSGRAGRGGQTCTRHFGADESLSPHQALSVLRGVGICCRQQYVGPVPDQEEMVVCWHGGGDLSSCI